MTLIGHLSLRSNKKLACICLLALMVTVAFFLRSAFVLPLGEVLVVDGNVLIGASGRGATVGDYIYEGDVIVTGPGAAVQIKTVDGGLVAIGAESELGIDAFVTANGEGNPLSRPIPWLKEKIRAIAGFVRNSTHAPQRSAKPVVSYGNRHCVTPSSATAGKSLQSCDDDLRA